MIRLQKRIRTRQLPARFSALSAALFLAACGGGSDGGGSGSAASGTASAKPGNRTPGTPQVDPTIRISVLSSKPHLVTGDDALVELEKLAPQPSQDFSVSLNGVDVTDVLQPNPANGRLVGKLTGLKMGDNELVAKFRGYRASQVLTAYPITGPVISGPHEQPFICGYETFTRMGGQKLTPTGDDKCSVVKRVDYYYRNSAGGNTRFVPESITEYPANMSYLTINGKRVPYVVRLESGTINRGLYQSAILHDVLNEPPPSPTSRPAGWTGGLIYPLGGGCQGGWFQQGNDFATLINPTYQSRGLAVTTSTLNVFGTNCNDQLSSETIAMVKERFIENFGVPPLHPSAPAARAAPTRATRPATTIPACSTAWWLSFGVRGRHVVDHLQAARLAGAEQLLQRPGDCRARLHGRGEEGPSRATCRSATSRT